MGPGSESREQRTDVALPFILFFGKLMATCILLFVPMTEYRMGSQHCAVSSGLVLSRHSIRICRGATAIGTTTNKGVEERQVTCVAARPSFSG